jgi:hypothetical protein
MTLRGGVAGYPRYPRDMLTTPSPEGTKHCTLQGGHYSKRMFKFSVVEGLSPGIVTRVVKTPRLAPFFEQLPLPSIDPATGRKRDDAPLCVMGECDVGAVATNATWRGSQTIMLDIDGNADDEYPPPPFEVAVAEATKTGYAFVAGPSARNGLAGARRYRIVFALADLVVATNVYAETAKHLAQLIGVSPDPRSYVPSQRWYGFTPTVSVDGPGAPLQMAVLNHAPSPSSIAAPVRYAVEGQRRTLLYRRARLAGSLAHCLQFDAARALAELTLAAEHVGLTPDEYERHITNGFRDGMDEPRDILVPCPPKPQGRPPKDPAQLAEYNAMAEAHTRWQHAARTAVDTGIAVIEHGHDEGRILYRIAGGRRVMPYASKEGAISLIREVAEASGLAVGADHAEAMMRDLLTAPSARVTTGAPSLFDTGTGYYRHEAPRAKPGPTPTWDTFLERLSDPEAFLAHVHALVEPKWKGRQVLWMQGEGNDGKTIAVNAIAAGTFGITNLGVLDDVALTNKDRFMLSSVWDKPMIFIPDTKNVNLVMSGIVHRLVGRDFVPVEYKGRPIFKAQFQGSVWVTSNPMPSIENSESNTSRLTIVTVRPPKEFIPDLERKYIAELPALLAKAKAAYDARSENDFRIRLNETATADLKAATSDTEDRFVTWATKIRLHVTHDDNDSVKSTEIYQAFESRGIKTYTNERAAFYGWLKRQGARIENRSDCKRIYGVRLPSA